MKGKEKCKALKEIRRQIAEQNDIPYAVSQCSHQGDCKGTCPKCEAELRYLERELAVRKNLGKAVAVAGISVGVCSSLTACSPIEAVQNINMPSSMQLPVGEVLVGDVPLETPESTQADWQLLLPNPGEIPIPSEATEGALPMPTPEIDTGMDFPPLQIIPAPTPDEGLEGEDEIVTWEIEGDIALPEDSSLE